MVKDKYNRYYIFKDSRKLNNIRSKSHVFSYRKLFKLIKLRKLLS